MLLPHCNLAGETFEQPLIVDEEEVSAPEQGARLRKSASPSHVGENCSTLPSFPLSRSAVSSFS
jgi:hypothetical protein